MRGVPWGYNTASTSHLQEHVENSLVILVGDCAAINTLLGVLAELHGKNVAIEEKLKLFIGQIDTELKYKTITACP